MDPVRVGVIGCGVIGPSHMRPAMESPLTDLVAVADLVPERAARAAEQFGARKTYAQGSELIADPEIEAVVLAFPAKRRAELALQAFSLDKHVLTEKPVACSAEEVHKMIAGQGDLVAACCSCRFRFTASARAAADFIATGALGKLRTVYCRELRPAGPQPEKIPPDWRLTKSLNGGGILMNWGCYDLDYLLGLCGWRLEPQTVLAQTWTCPPQFEAHIAPGSDAETYYTALVRCADGVVLSVERGEYMPTQGEAAWQIIGTQGSLQLHMTAAKGKRIVFDAGTTEGGVESRVIWQDEEDSSVTGAEPILDLARAIRQGGSPSTPLTKALVIQQISDAIYESAATAQAVVIR